jgi:hypothetical protein
MAALETRLTTVSKVLNSKLNSVCENLEAQMKRENEILDVSLTKKFKAENEKVRQELSLEVQKEINNRTRDIELLRKNSETELGKISDNIDAVSRVAKSTSECKAKQY